MGSGSMEHWLLESCGVATLMQTHVDHAGKTYGAAIAILMHLDSVLASGIFSSLRTWSGLQRNTMPELTRVTLGTTPGNKATALWTSSGK